MDTLCILALVAAVIGVAGSIIPGIPGPPVSWVGFLLLYLDKCPGRDGDPMSMTFLLVWLGVVVVVTVLDYLVPAWFTQVTGGGRAASVGAIVGLFAGMFLTPIGMILGSILGAFLGDFIFQDHGVWAAFKASIGAFLGFICSTGMKLIISGIMLYYTVVYVF